MKAPPEWIDRLLGVLIDNACRYSPTGGEVAITTVVAGPQARIIVDDTGPGIPEQERHRLFDRFHRATAQPGGAGLGLAIADAIVRSTNGHWLISDSPTGGPTWKSPGIVRRHTRIPGPATPRPGQT